MAAPAAHIVCAERVLQKLPHRHQISIEDFLRGTLFPDIRYFVGIDRELTHFHNANVDNAAQITDSFKLGIYVHSIVDWERFKLLKRLNVDEVVPHDPTYHQALKSVEDPFFWDERKKWSDVPDLINDVSNISFDGVSSSQIKQWYKSLCDYFLQKPTHQSVEKFLSDTDIGHLVRQEKLLSCRQELNNSPKVLELSRRVAKELLV